MYTLCHYIHIRTLREMGKAFFFCLLACLFVQSSVEKGFGMGICEREVLVIDSEAPRVGEPLASGALPTVGWGDVGQGERRSSRAGGKHLLWMAAKFPSLVPLFRNPGF